MRNRVPTPGIKQDMYMPLHLEFVRVEGHHGLFMVVKADYKRQSADLISVSKKERLTGVSFASLVEVSDDREAVTERESSLPPADNRALSFRVK